MHVHLRHSCIVVWRRGTSRGTSRGMRLSPTPTLGAWRWTLTAHARYGVPRAARTTHFPASLGYCMLQGGRGLFASSSAAVLRLAYCASCIQYGMPLSTRPSD